LRRRRGQSKNIERAADGSAVLPRPNGERAGVRGSFRR
jgi:hypothetical protein